MKNIRILFLNLFLFSSLGILLYASDGPFGVYDSAIIAVGGGENKPMELPLYDTAIAQMNELMDQLAQSTKTGARLTGQALARAQVAMATVVATVKEIATQSDNDSEEETLDDLD